VNMPIQGTAADIMKRAMILQPRSKVRLMRG
jgi:DNA polymerase I-like protein with 3'-5' exonuclease and polymerase domains